MFTLDGRAGHTTEDRNECIDLALPLNGFGASNHWRPDYWLGQMHRPGEENSQCTDIEATELLAAKTIKATLS